MNENYDVFYALDHLSHLRNLADLTSAILLKLKHSENEGEDYELLLSSLTAINSMSSDSNLHLKTFDEYRKHISLIASEVSTLNIFGSEDVSVVEISNIQLITKNIQKSLESEKFSSIMYCLKLMHFLEVYSGIDVKEKKRDGELALADILDKANKASLLFSSIKEAVDKVEYAKSQGLKQITSATAAMADAATTEVGLKITKDFRDTADDEKKQAEFYRLGAIACFGCSVIVLIINAIFGSVPIDFEELLYKAGPVLFFTIPAFYLAKESASHRADYRKYKHLALNLPIGIKYIDGLDENSRHMVQADFAKHLLMYTESATPNQNQDVKPLSDQIDKINTILSEFKSAVEKMPKT